VDVVAWAVLGLVVGVAIVLGALAPRLRRDNLRRQLAGGGGALSGVGAGFDAIWRPSAEEAHAQWQASTEMPAPAPAPSDRGLDDGPLVVEIPARTEP
jgi:hypothetical protein